MPVLRIPTPLRAYTNGKSDVNVNGSNISDALTDLTTQYPALKPHLFNEGGEILQACHHLPRYLAIDSVMPADDDQARAQPERLTHRHGTAHTQFACGIRTGGDYAAFLRSAAYSKGFAAQVGIACFFHGAIEGIEVKVQNSSLHRVDYTSCHWEFCHLICNVN